MKVIKSDKIYNNAQGSAPAFTEARFGADYSLICALNESLKEVEGQAFAVQAVKEYLFGINNRENPKGVGGLLTFIGPPACGKTLVGEQIAKALHRPYLRLDLSSFNDKEIGMIDLFGINTSYKSATAGQLTSFAEAHPVSVVLLDEFEKAHPNVLNRFLSIFDRGDAIDLFTERNVSFRDVIFIVTSNLGSKIYDKSLTAYNLSSTSQKTILQALKKEINPLTKSPYLSEAVISRLSQGRIVLFNKLRPELMRDIVMREFLKCAEYYREKYGLNFKANAAEIAELILLSLGENADVRSAVKSVREFFEVHVERLVRASLQKNCGAFTEVTIKNDLSKLTQKAESAFFGGNKVRILVACGNAQRSKFLKSVGERAEVVFADESAETAVKDMDLSAAIIDAEVNEERYLGKLFKAIIAQNDIPVYVYSLKKNAEVKLQSYMDGGATDRFSGRVSFCDWIGDICGGIAYSALSQALSRANQILKYGVAYTLKGRKAAIEISDLELCTAKDSDDEEKFVTARQAPNVRLKDVYGAAEAKREIRDVIEVLRNFKKYRRMGLRLPRGVLLSGEPGTGKTMLAKALACEAGMEFIERNATEFAQKFVGEGARLLRETFEAARRYAPAIVFIDEVDAIAKSRQNAIVGEDNSGVLNALLSEMDGFADNSATPVFVVAATNFDAKKGETLLDPAFLRRFDRVIEIELPDLETRKAYLADKLQKYSAEVTERATENLAKRSIGWSLGELDTVIQNALRGVLCGGGRVTDEVLNSAFETYASGESKPREQKELFGTAVHEAGHAVVAAALGIMPSYATIVARGNAGGYVYYGDERVTKLSLKDCLNRICIMMAGRAAEQAEFGEDGITTGISGDLKAATELATSMLCDYGMGEYPLYIAPAKRAETAWVSEGVAEIISEQAARAKELIEANGELMRAVTVALLEKVSLDEADLKTILEREKGGII